MGTRRLDRIDFEQWAQFTPQCGRMLKRGWKVRAECQTCKVQLHVDLRHVITARGWTFNLWGVRTPCRNLRCRGEMDFWALPPGGVSWGQMEGHWLARHPIGRWTDES